MVAQLARQAHPLHIEFTVTGEGDERSAFATPLYFLLHSALSCALLLLLSLLRLRRAQTFSFQRWVGGFSLGFFKPQQSDLAPYPIALSPQRPTSFTEGLLGKWSKSLTAELPGNDFLNCALIPFCTVLRPLGASLCLACLPALLSLP